MANPEQSKHLETAALRLHGPPIDLVHLRSETYTAESRIPTIQVGTPEQDASRRDFTINSLFYNVNQQKVEDLTGKGLDDLKNGIIRTPLDPHITLMDGMSHAPVNLHTRIAVPRKPFNCLHASASKRAQRAHASTSSLPSTQEVWISE